jgi:hypothetical protein
MLSAKSKLISRPGRKIAKVLGNGDAMVAMKMQEARGGNRLVETAICTEDFKNEPFQIYNNTTSFFSLFWNLDSSFLGR